MRNSTSHHPFAVTAYCDVIAVACGTTTVLHHEAITCLLRRVARLNPRWHKVDDLGSKLQKIHMNERFEQAVAM